MKIRNHLARLVAGALLASSAATAVALAPSAADAATPTVSVHLGAPTYGYSTLSVVEYGSTFNFDGTITTNDGSDDEGTVDLQVLSYGSTAWRTIKTNTYGYTSFMDIPATIGSSYRLYVHSYTSYDDVSYPAKYSNVVGVKVARKLTVKTNGLHVKGKVSPAHGKMKIVFKVKKGKHYKKWFKVTTKKNGKFKKTVPHEKIGTKVLVMTPGGQGYTANVWYGQYY